MGHPPPGRLPRSLRPQVVGRGHLAAAHGGRLRTPPQDYPVLPERPVAVTMCSRKGRHDGMSEIGDRTGPAIGDLFGPPTEEHRLIPEITYDEHLYPARPRRLRPSARRVLRDIIRSGLSGATDGTNDSYVKWLVEQSMLHDAQALATQLSGQGSMWQNPFAASRPARRGRARGGVVHRLPAVVHHPQRRVVPVGSGRPRAVAGVSARSASTPSTPGRSSWRAASTAGARPARSTATSTASACRSTRRSGPRTSSARLCAIGRRARRHRDRRHRPGPHGQGRGLPPRRDGLRRLPGHLPHGLDRPRGLAPAARRPRRPRLRQPRRSSPRPSSRRPATSSASSSG